MLLMCSRSASTSCRISSSRCLTASPRLTIPRSRPSSPTTGTWRTRRSVISPITAATRSRGAQVSTSRVITSSTRRSSTPPPWPARTLASIGPPRARRAVSR
jgi:hypothetical protein